MYSSEIHGRTNYTKENGQFCENNANFIFNNANQKNPLGNILDKKICTN